MSLPGAILVNGGHVDLSTRFASNNNTVVASPSGASETVVGRLLAIPSNIQVTAGVVVAACLAYTVGTNGVSVRYRIRQGITAGSGTVIYDSGVTTAGISAANLVQDSFFGVDTAASFPGQQYCVTLTVGSGSATSTVTTANLIALII